MNCKFAKCVCCAKDYAEENILPKMGDLYKKAYNKLEPYGEAAAEAVLPYSEKAREIADDVVSRTESFSPLDWMMLKVMLVSLGVLIGTALSKLFKKIAPIVALVAIVSTIYTVWRLFFNCCDDE